MTQRLQLILIFILSMLFWTNVATAQDPERIKTITISADSAYTKVVQALQESGYYIAQLDRSSGFIQTSVSLKSKSIFGRDGDKRIFNFLVVPLPDRRSKIILNIFLFERLQAGSGNSGNYYYDDKGLVQDDKIYQQIWDKILPLIQ